MAEQNLANHAKFFPLFHFFVLPVLLVNLGIQVYWLKEAKERWRVTVWRRSMPTLRRASTLPIFGMRDF